MSTTLNAQVITHISIVSIRVKDQDAALRFYTEQLGFEKRLDSPMGDGTRWLTVAPAGSTTEIVLVNWYDLGAPLGGNTGLVLETADMDAAYRLLAARGVRFTQLPERQPWGAWAEFADQDGNTIGLHADA